MNHRLADWKVWMEVILAIIAGEVFIRVFPQWLDLDEVIEPFSFIVLLGAGLVFGVFGRLPVLFATPAFALPMLGRSCCDGLDLLQFIFSAVMWLPVLLGAATGRQAKQCWKKQKA